MLFGWLRSKDLDELSGVITHMRLCNAHDEEALVKDNVFRPLIFLWHHSMTITGMPGNPRAKLIVAGRKPTAYSLADGGTCRASAADSSKLC